LHDNGRLSVLGGSSRPQSAIARDCSRDTPTNDAKVIRQVAGECLKRVALDPRIRLLGVRVGTLSPSVAEGQSGDDPGVVGGPEA
jgi:DNA polymerase-4